MKSPLGSFLLCCSVLSGQAAAETLTLTGKIEGITQAMEIQDYRSTVGHINPDGTFSITLDSQIDPVFTEETLQGVDNKPNCKNDSYFQSVKGVSFLTYRIFNVKNSNQLDSSMRIAGGYEGDTWYGGNGDFAAFVYASQNVTVHELWSCQSRKDYYSGFVDLNLKKG